MENGDTIGLVESRLPKDEYMPKAKEPRMGHNGERYSGYWELLH